MESILDGGSIPPIYTKHRIIRAAGILEGEGSFFLPKDQCTPIVSCNMTDEDVIIELHSLFGGYIGAYDAKYENSKPYWQWRVYGVDAVYAMESVKPYMFSRRADKIDEVLKVWYDRQEVIENETASRVALATAYLNGEGSYRVVAKKYGTSRTAVFNAVKKFDIPS